MSTAPSWTRRSTRPSPNPADKPWITRGVVVVYQGRIIAERYRPGFTKDTALISQSMAKSVLNALTGILVGQGKLSLYAPAPVHEWADPKDPRHAITLDNLLRMASGLKFNENYTSAEVRHQHAIHDRRLRGLHGGDAARGQARRRSSTIRPARRTSSGASCARRQARR